MVAKDSSEIEVKETIAKYILHFNRFSVYVAGITKEKNQGEKLIINSQHASRS